MLPKTGTADCMRKLTWNGGEEPERPEDPEGSQRLHVEAFDLKGGKDGGKQAEQI